MEKLVEIKKGQYGKGLLIEEDGYIELPKDKILKEAFSPDGEWEVPNPFIVDAVFQKFGIKNANGRIYPEHLLKEQVAKYQEVIDENRALGECYKPDAKVLTKTKWKEISKLRKGEYIYTLKTDTFEVELQKVEQVIKKQHNGEMIHIVGPDIDDVVTPGHKFPVYKIEGDRYVFQEHVEAQKLHDFGGYIPLFYGWIDVSKCSFFSENYEGEVVCLDVPNHTFLVECNNNQHWTSNCNHPQESTIDLSRVSHRIIELHWEGHTLVGKMVLNTTEGFRKHGIVTSCGDEVANLLLNGYRIGVSSRGVGSVVQRLGQAYVGDDFQLICWDVVSQPSTPNAYISIQGHDSLEAYVEDDESKKGLEPINEKISKIKDILKG
jgi:hypothetical protein